MASGDGDAIQILLDRVEKGRYRSNQRPPSICRVSNVLRCYSPTSFDPEVISIGPLHKEKENVKEVEVLKESYLHDLVQDLESTPAEILKECWQKVYASIDQIKASYACIQNITDMDLANMMVMDGCFILEFCYKLFIKEYVNELQKYLIVRDLFLLENQIPFFVLENLFDCTLKRKISQVSLTVLLYTILGPYIHPFCNPFPTEFAITKLATDSSTPTHLLGFIHKCYQPLDAKPEICSSNVPSAAELDRSGVYFKTHQDKDYPMTMRFKSFVFSHLHWRKPTLIMPIIVFDDDTEEIFRNFIAYEQSIPGIPFYFTSYAWAMYMLIDSEEDISILVESKVLVNNLGSRKEAANLFNKICKDIPLPYFYFEQVFKRLDEYYHRLGPRNIAWLRRTFFLSFALYGGIILFIFAVVQTLFSILAVFPYGRK